MKKSVLATAALALAVSGVPAAPVLANDIAAGLLGGIIGGVIVNEASKNRRTVYRAPAVSSATREQNRLTQTSLNYFGFPAGTPDGVLGRQSRGAISQYQAHMGYPVTGYLTDYEQNFLVTSYNRAMAGGPATMQRIAAMPQGPRGLLTAYRDEMAGAAQAPATTVVVAPSTGGGANQPVTTVTTTTVSPAPATGTPIAAPALPAIPNFMGEQKAASLASHCNKVSLLTNTNGGFATEANMVDANFALNEQFCLARTYAIAEGEELVGRLQGFTSAQIEEQCNAFGPAMKEHVAGLSLKPHDEVVREVGAFVLKTGMSPAQLSGTSKICLSVGYRTDNMDVAIGSALLLVVLGEPVYAELLGHHLSQGFGATRRQDLALAWYTQAIDALEGGAEPVFAPAQTERAGLLRRAAYTTEGAPAPVAVPAAGSTGSGLLPSFLAPK
jgi:peptidoglycan hydrolase-like protein with peptidoglycan-binding domain